MTRTAVITILASIGIVYTGPLTKDAIALASAIQIGDREALGRFAEAHPQSPFAPRVREIAETLPVPVWDNPRAEAAWIVHAAFAQRPAPFTVRPDSKLKKVQYSDGGSDSYSSGSDPETAAQRSARQSTRAVSHLQTALLRYERELSSCDPAAQRELLFECLADAIETFADRVEKTPPTLNGVAPEATPVLRQAATRIRRATTVAEARQAVAEAAEPIRKSIALVRAGGDDIFTRQAALQRSIVTSALDKADAVLVKAVGI